MFRGVCIVHGGGGGGGCGGPPPSKIVVRSKAVLALPPGHVRVAPKYSGICGSDLHAYHNNNNNSDQLIRGHEVSGIVIERGQHVTGFSDGDAVVLEPLIGCNACKACLEKHNNHCKSLNIVGVMSDGGMAEQLIVPDYCLYKLPSDIDLRVGVLAEPVAVLVHAFRRAGFYKYEKPRERLLILGAGSIGIVGMVVAHALGMPEIILSYKYDFQKQLASKLAASIGIRNVSFVDQSDLSLLGDNAPDLILETVGGRANTLEEAMKLVSNGGEIIVLGLFEPDAPKIDSFSLLCKEVTVKGSNCYSKNTNDFVDAISILQSHGNVLAEVLITHQFPLEEAEKAFSVSSHKNQEHSLKVILEL